MDINLPACNYLITETALDSNVNTDILADHYTTAYTVAGTPAVAGQKYPLTSGEKETVVFTNTYKRHYANLNITKSNAEDAEQVFVYKVERDGDPSFAMYVTVTGNGTTTIKDVPLDNYTVTQQNDWSWRYDDESVDIEKSALEDGNEVVNFVKAEEKRSWLTGNSQLEKNRKDG